MQKSTLLYCFFCFIHSLEQFWSVRKHFLCYLDQKKWISGTLPALGLRPRAGKIFPWFTFSDLDNIGKIFSHYLKIVLRSGNRKNNITKYNCYDLSKNHFPKWILSNTLYPCNTAIFTPTVQGKNLQVISATQLFKVDIRNT